MLDIILLVLVGMFVGWNMPQPAYAKLLQTWVMAKVRSFSEKEDK